MEKLIIGLYNKDVQFIESEQLSLFVNEDEAAATITRSLRDSYIKGEVTEDWLKGHCFVQVGKLDTRKRIALWPMEDDVQDPYVIDCWNQVKDLKEDAND